MSTEFRTADGRLVALRYYGGDGVGLRVDLLAGAASLDVGFDTPLFGCDGSESTLRGLAAQVATNSVDRSRREVARWESPRGAHRIALYSDALGYSYRGDGCGGVLGSMDSDADAVCAMLCILPGMFPGRYRRVVPECSYCKGKGRRVQYREHACPFCVGGE